MSKMLKTDEQLILSISGGSERAFEEIYERYERKLMGYLVYRIKNQEIAQELFQVTWSKVLQNSHKFKKEKSFSPWLMTIAANLVKDWFKKTSNYQRLIKAYGLEESDQNSASDNLPNLSFLKNQSQTILKLKYIEGLSSKEIGETMNLSESNVRKLSSRALKQIKEHIESGGHI